MTAWALALLGAVVGAWVAYGRLGRSDLGRSVTRPVAALGLGALRGAAYLCLLAILLDAPLGRSASRSPLGVLDVSASWQRASSAGYFAAARDSLRALVDDSLVLVGDSARLVDDPRVAATPEDARSALRPAIDLAQALQRPVLVVTDGEIAEADVWSLLPPGSQVILPPRAPARDVAIATLDAPSLATGGDTIAVVIGVSAGNVPTEAGRVLVTIDGEERAAIALAPLEAYTSRRLGVRLALPRGTSTVELAAIVSTANDVEPRNDTLRRTLDVSDRPRAVFLSTAPDLDVREALRVLRGTVAIPTRAYLRVAPGVWREEGTLAPVAEAEVERRARAAGLLVLHGDTAWAGVAVARPGPTVLWAATPPAPPARAGVIAAPEEWFLTRGQPSPLGPVLDALPFDSLPPIALPPAAASPAPSSPAPSSAAERADARGAATVPVLEARLGRRGPSRVLATVKGEGARRRAVILGSGYAAWVQRGGRAADAFSALWGAIFDWAAAAEGSVGGVRIAQEPVRAGEPLVWRRGTADSVVTVRLAAAGGEASSATLGADSLVLRFGADGASATSAPLPAGRYRVQVGDAAFPLVVNRSREWVPARPVNPPVIDTPAEATRPTGPARPWRESAWPFVLALVLLCVEWLARRAVGLR